MRAVGLSSPVGFRAGPGRTKQCRGHGQHQQDDVRQRLRTRRAATGDQVRVEVAPEQHALEEQHRRRPYARAAAEPGQDQLADERLDLEQQVGADEDGQREERNRRAGSDACLRGIASHGELRVPTLPRARGCGSARSCRSPARCRSRRPAGGCGSHGQAAGVPRRSAARRPPRRWPHRRARRASVAPVGEGHARIATSIRLTPSSGAWRRLTTRSSSGATEQFTLPPQGMRYSRTRTPLPTSCATNPGLTKLDTSPCTNASRTPCDSAAISSSSTEQASQASRCRSMAWVAASSVSSSQYSSRRSKPG